MDQEECIGSKQIASAPYPDDKALPHQATLAGHGRMQYREMDNGPDNQYTVSSSLWKKK